LKPEEIMKQVGKCWKSLKAAERAVYERKAVSDKQRYVREMRVWQRDFASLNEGEKSTKAII
jgi:hypothetical protein